MEYLGHPERHYDVIHIGGTNGKGSVAAMIHAALNAAGIRAALYTSPHLVDVWERMVVGSQPITKDAFASWTARLEPVISEVNASFFEATTAIALADFAARGAEVAVIEVGLGGRLDSTNVLEPLVSAVTGISREHVGHLGESLVEIAREKAGIAKPGVPFVIGETDPGLIAVLVAAAAKVSAMPHIVPRDVEYEGPLALPGFYQRRNAAIAEAVLNELPGGYRPPGSAVAHGFATVHLAGRFTRRGKWILDVAHNLGAMTAFLAALDAEQPPRPIHALVSILGDKDWQSMVWLVANAVDVLWVTIPPSVPEARRWSLEAVRDTLADDVVVEPDFDAALTGVQRGAATVVVTGSFHTVGDAMARLPGFTTLR